jgi:predicted porin
VRSRKIVLAVIAAVSMPAFADSANVNVYGNFDVSYDSINTGTPTKGASGTTSNRVSSNTSFIGVKGFVDAGNGLSAIWQVESLINVGDSTANGTPTGATTNNGIGYLGSRNTFAGLKHDSYGTVLAGRYDTPYRLSTRRFDVFDRGIADNRSILGGSNVAAKASFDGRQDQVVAYISPNLGGVTVLAAHVNLNPTVNIGGPYQGNATSVAAWYDVNGVYGALAYEKHNLQNFATSGYLGSEHATRLGFGYTRQGVFAVGFVAENTSDDLGSGGSDLYGHNAYYVSGKFNVGNAAAIKAAFTDAGNIGGGNTAYTGAKQYTLGYDFSLNRRTTLYALYTKLQNASAANYSLSIYNGTAASIGGPSTLAGTGASPSAVAAGVLVTF